MTRGVAGLVADGGIRDAGPISEMPFPVFCSCPSAPLNLAQHHALESNIPIGCGGVAIFPDDVIMVDDDGAVVIPQKLLEDVAAVAADQERMEEWIMTEVGKGASLPGLYPPNAENKARYEAWAKQQR